LVPLGPQVLPVGDEPCQLLVVGLGHGLGQADALFGLGRRLGPRLGPLELLAGQLAQAIAPRLELLGTQQLASPDALVPPQPPLLSLDGVPEVAAVEDVATDGPLEIGRASCRKRE